MPNIKERATAFLMARRAQRAIVTQREPLTPAVTRIRFSTENALPWRSGQHIKCEIAPYTYRDYTLASWDAGSQTATLLLHTSHDGAGSQWVRSLLPGDTFRFAGPGGGQHQPTAAPHLVCLGDASALGHFQSLFLHCNLEQYFTAAIRTSQEDAHRLTEALEMPVLALPAASDLRPWLHAHGLSIQNTTFYLAGGNALVVQYRQHLKSMGVQGANVKAAGFWD